MEQPSSSAAQLDEASPALVVMKRVRNLKKRLERIQATEALRASGKQMNKEQQEMLSTKDGVLGAIAELEKLREAFAVPQPAPADKKPKQKDTEEQPAVHDEESQSQPSESCPAVDPCRCVRPVLAVLHAAALLNARYETSLDQATVTALQSLAKRIAEPSLSTPRSPLDSLQTAMELAVKLATESPETTDEQISYAVVSARAEQVLQTAQPPAAPAPAPVAPTSLLDASVAAVLSPLSQSYALPPIMTMVSPASQQISSITSSWAEQQAQASAISLVGENPHTDNQPAPDADEQPAVIQEPDFQTVPSRGFGQPHRGGRGNQSHGYRGGRGGRGGFQPRGRGSRGPRPQRQATQPTQQ